VPSRQWFGDIYTSFAATTPAVVEHSSPTDLRARKISSITVPAGHFTDGDGRGEVGEAAPQLLQGPGVGLFF